MTHDDRIHIVIVDRHIMFRTGLRMLLETKPHIEVVGECGSSSDALKIVTREGPNMVLLDLNLEAGDPFALIDEFSDKTNVIVLTGEKDSNLHQKCLTLGAKGIVLKEDASDVLFKAIEKVHCGELWYDLT